MERIYPTGRGNRRPPPGPEPTGETVVDRVVEDGLEGRAVLLFGLDLSGPEATAEDVALAAVSFVEGTRVLAVQVAHPLREGRERGLDEEGVGVSEETARVQPAPIAPAGAPEDPDEDRAVMIVQEDRGFVVPLRADVVVGAWLSVTERSSDAATVAAFGAAERSRASLDTLPFRTR